MLDIRVVTIFYTIPLRHHTSPRVSAADKDDEASTRRKRPRARPPRKRFLFGTRRNKKPKSPRNPVYNVKRVHVPRTPFVRRRPPPRRRGVVVAASRDASDDEVRSALRRDDGVDGAERARAGARRERASARNDATTTARTTTAKRGDGRWRGRIFPARDRRGGGGGRASRASRALKREKNARGGCARGRREWGRSARDGGRRARGDGERRAARRANDSRALTDGFTRRTRAGSVVFGL